jgi:hypothetical protein
MYESWFSNRDKDETTDTKYSEYILLISFMYQISICVLNKQLAWIYLSSIN